MTQVKYPPNSPYRKLTTPDNVGSDENSPSHASIISSPGSFQKRYPYIPLKGLDNPRSTSLRPLSTSDANTQNTRLSGLSLNNAVANLDCKNTVVNSKGSDTINGYGILKEVAAYSQRDFPPVERDSLEIKAVEVELENVDAHVIDLYPEGTESPSDDELSLINNALELGANSPELKYSVISKEEDPSYDSQRLSYLNPHQPFVKVHPPRLGQPLAPNDTELDLSSVEKHLSVYPLAFDDEPEISKDELKLLSILGYELKKEGVNLNWEFPAEIDEIITVEDDEHEDVSKSGFLNSMRLIFQRLFKTGEYSERSKYFRTYPWYDLLYRVDHPEEYRESEKPFKRSKDSEFERNNKNMFATQDDDHDKITTVFALSGTM